MAENKIGTFATETHGVYWPDVTISGRPYRRPASHYRGIGNNQFVVLDQFPDPAFDVAAAIAELITPPKRKRKAEESDEQTPA